MDEETPHGFYTASEVGIFVDLLKVLIGRGVIGSLREMSDEDFNAMQQALFERRRKRGVPGY